MSKSGSKVLWVHYGEEGAKQHDFSSGRDLKTHIEKIVKMFGLQEPPDSFLISCQENGQHVKYLSQADFDTTFTTTPNTKLVLRLPFQQVDLVISELKDPKRQKIVLHELSKKHLTDSEFAQEFMQRDGVGLLEGLLATAVAGTLGKVLQAIDRVMEVAIMTGLFEGLLGDCVLEKCVSSLISSNNLQVLIYSLKLISKIISCDKSGFWVVHRELVQAANKKQQQPYEAVISALKNGDLNIKVGALNVINAFIEHSPDKAIFEEFLVLIEDFGYLQELKAQLVAVQSPDFKRAVFWHQVAKSDHWGLEKNIPYDKENKDHEDCLYELWNTCFPETKLESRVSEQWKLLGFQGTDPATDFRGMGLLGLKHILYFAKNYTSTFVEMAKIQQSRESHYYPVSTAGINISQMLLDVLNIGKKEGRTVGGVSRGGGGGSSGDDEEKFAIFPILFDHRRALEEMYCLVFRMFHRVWDEMNADYMDFMNVASAVREKTVNALNSVEDLEGFAKHIGVMDWQGAGRGREEGRVSSLLDMEMVEQHCPSKQEKSRGFRKSQQPKRGPRTQMNMGHRATSPSPVLARMGGLGNSQQRSTGDLLGGGGGLAGSMGGGGGETKSFDASLLSDNVNLDIFVQLANQSTQLSVSRMSSIKDVVENVTRTLKKKMKKPKKGEIQALYNTVTGIWLDDQRKVWSYLLKDNDKLELKCKPPSLQTRKVDIEIHLESSTFNQPVHYLGESTVFGVIQAIDKPKSVLEKIHLYGLFLGSDGGRGDVWLDESRTLASYGLNDSKLKFSLRSNKEDSTSSASSRAQAPLPPSSASTPSHIAGGWALPQAPAAATPAPAAGGWASSTSPSTSSSSSPRDPPLSSSPSLPAPISPSQRAQAPLPPSTSKELESWTVNEVVEWVKGLGLGEHAGAFERGRVDGKTLSEMTGPNLRTLGIQALGTRKEILRQVKSAKGE